ncbi:MULTISPECIES: response regulator transcription factor [unclassified Streptomyces]|uniref:response regulator n=1 Tax=unclassified Streptomyces TaxID=2593676 RepID=UPI0006F70635|nr:MULTISPECIES: response regulator transcription factor [unclassified Streptomyces]KQX46337.1 LuxR family transcriptional regulator [Streptomyces sp. Root1304]KRA81122.1 LuxR family transcriptional regulator [Streptomyces sp. Root66D1]
MPSVLVVDDQILVRAGLAALLRMAPGVEVVGEACDGDDAVRQVAATSPDVVLMDIRMPGTDGIQATERILAQPATARPAPLDATPPRTDPTPPRVIVLTTFDLDAYVYSALRAGASGFLLKETPPERLVTAVHTVAAGDMLFSPSVTRRLIEAYAPAPAPEDCLPPAWRTVTNRENEVLVQVARGLSNGEIAQQLLLSEATVKTHLNRAMAKLGLSSRAQAVVFAYETGLVVPGHTRTTDSD